MTADVVPLHAAARRAHLGLAAFLNFVLPRARVAAEGLRRPACCVSVITRARTGASSVQISAGSPPPGDAAGLRRLLDSLPPQTIFAWFL